MQWIDGNIVPRGRPGARGSPRAPGLAAPATTMRPDRSEWERSHILGHWSTRLARDSETEKSPWVESARQTQWSSGSNPFHWWPPGAVAEIVRPRQGPVSGEASASLQWYRSAMFEKDPAQEAGKQWIFTPLGEREEFTPSPRRFARVWWRGSTTMLNYNA